MDKPIRDIELALHFPERISRQKRDRLAHWGAAFIVAQLALFIVFLVI